MRCKRWCMRAVALHLTGIAAATSQETGRSTRSTAAVSNGGERCRERNGQSCHSCTVYDEPVVESLLVQRRLLYIT